jgi:pyridoxamine 5'-phosphate oxidase
MNGKKIAELRKEYQKEKLDETGVDKDPIIQFGKWFQESLEAEVNEANAMTLATADRKGRPSARIVLLKGFDEDGFVFFTNYKSEKGRDLKENPYAALVFFWPELERQIRISGKVKRISATESEDYFNSRPLESRIGAIASSQSEVIASREVLEEKFERIKEAFMNREPERPRNWGGFILKPITVEFWQGRPNRLHDRILFSRKKKGSWKIERLAP